MIGIYKIQNKENGKIYIGQSNDIERRIKEHCYPSRYKNNYPIDVAIHKYGKTAFTFDVVEECNLNELNEREEQWIKYYQSNTNKGYNCNEGGSQASIGENNPKAKLTESDVVAIRSIYNKKGSKASAYELVKNKTSWSNFESVWQGATWKHIMPEVYTEENKKYYQNGKAVITNNKYSDDEIMELRQLYVDHTAKELYEQSDKRLSYTSFQQLLNGTSFDYLPYYMKKLKRWVSPEEEKPKVSQNRGYHTIKNQAFTDEEVNFFRQEYVDKTAQEIYEQYPNAQKVGSEQFSKILRGVTYKHLPYYSKKNKTWINPEPVSTISVSGE